jgi:hypothetical protein
MAKTSRVAAVLRVMVREASTSIVQRTTPVRADRHPRMHPGNTKELRRVRGRILLIVLAIVLLALLGGLGYLGLNPPNPAPKPVEKVLPNDKFQAH